MQLGEWIRRERRKRPPPENTQAWLADKMGVAQTTISKWERGPDHGGSEVSREEQARLEETFGTTYASDKKSDNAREEPLRVPVMGQVRAHQAVDKAGSTELEYIEP